MPTKPTLFIGSSTEAKPVARCIASILDQSIQCTPWWDACRPSTFLLQELEDIAARHRFGLFIGKADDFLLSRDHASPSVRTNVLAEFFLFVGKNNHQHTFLVLDSEPEIDLPSDLEGFIVGKFSSSEFERNPSAAVDEVCRKVEAQIFEVYRADNEAKRHQRALALQAKKVAEAQELADLAFLLRETFDALQHDALDSLADPKRFITAKEKVSDRIREICAKRQPSAQIAGVHHELAALERSLSGIVVGIPYPDALHQGFTDAQRLVRDSMLGRIPGIMDALDRRDIGRAREALAELKGRLTPEALAQEVALLFEKKLLELKTNYAQWWKIHSKNVNTSLTRFQRALQTASNKAAIYALEEHTGP